MAANAFVGRIAPWVQLADVGLRLNTRSHLLDCPGYCW